MKNELDRTGDLLRLEKAKTNLLDKVSCLGLGDKDPDAKNVTDKIKNLGNDGILAMKNEIKETWKYMLSF